VAKDEPLPLTDTIRFNTTEDGEPLMIRVVVAGGEDGRTYIVHPQGAKVLVYRADGTFDRAIGRRGKGPGEFHNIWTTGWTGDTVWIYDGYPNRVTYLHGSAVSGIETVPRPSSMPRNWPDREVFRLADSTFVWTIPLRPAGSYMDLDPTPIVVLHTDHTGAPKDTIAKYTCVRDAVSGKSPTGGPSVADRPITTCDITTADARGEFVYHLSRLVPTGSDTTHFTITRWKPGGVVWTRNVPFTPRKLTKGFSDTAAAMRLANYTMRGTTDLARASLMGDAQLTQVYHPEVYDAATGVDGTLFLQRKIDTDYSIWTMMKPDGQMAGSIRLAPGERVLAANGPFVWVSGRDADGQLEVVRYRIGKAGS
jgi:hypothetical protein